MAKNNFMAGAEGQTFDLSGGATVNAGVNASNDDGGMVFDLSGVEEEKGFELLPKGTYNAIVEEMEFTESSSGNPMMAVQYSVTDPEYENRRLFDYWVLAGDGAEFGKAKLKKFLVRVCPEVDITNFNPKAFAESGDAIGRELRIVVKIQTTKKGEYKGQKRNQVSDILPPDNSGSFLG